MKYRLTICLIFLFFLFVVTVNFGFPVLSDFFALDVYRQIAVLFLILSAYAILISLAVDLIFSLPFNLYLKGISESWKKNRSLLLSNRNSPSEFIRIGNVFQEIMGDSLKSIRSLESKAGLSEGHSQIITMVSHQMRTPIGGLKWMLSELLEKNKNSEDVSLIREAVEATDRVSDIIEELLRGIGLEHGLSKEHRSDVDMISVVKSVMAETKLIARSRDVSVFFSHDELVPLVDGNEQELRFSVHTLVSNAVHYSSKGGEVKLILRSDGQKVVLEVIDRGIGISQSEKAMIFTKFGRSKESISLYPNGTGLSLYLTKIIVGNHQGELEYTSEPKFGTTFKIVLSAQRKGQLETFIKH